MAKTMMTKTEVWRVDSEKEAEDLIQEIVSESGGELKKKTIERKTKKSKGMIIDENFKVSLTIYFADQFDMEG